MLVTFWRKSARHLLVAAMRKNQGNHNKTSTSICQIFFVAVLAIVFSAFSFIMLPAFAGNSSAESQCRKYFVKSDVLERITSSEYTVLLEIARYLVQAQQQPHLVSQDVKLEIDLRLREFLNKKNFTKDEAQEFRSLFVTILQSYENVKRDSIIKVGQENNSNKNFLKKQTKAHKKSILKRENRIKLKKLLKKYRAESVDEAFVASASNMLRNTNDSAESRIEDMKFLLLMGANKNYQSAFGMTALINASFNADICVVEFLMEIRADPTLRTLFGATAYNITATNRFTMSEQRADKDKIRKMLKDYRNKYFPAWYTVWIKKLLRQP